MACKYRPCFHFVWIIIQNAGQPAAVRGLATNVANYSGWKLASAPPYTSGDSNYDEKLYVNALAPLLLHKISRLILSPLHVRFCMSLSIEIKILRKIVRNGVQPTSQLARGDWCNVIGTGFGVRPMTNTGDPLEGAFVWVKPGGECDGTSNTTSARYDFHCGLADALQLAPEAGTWF
jgi:cellulose 1,4-beta-cellobiosidase